MEIDQLYEIYQLNPVICTDTRDIKPNCLFFALKGENFNGNKFANEAIEKGASYVIIDEENYKTSTNHILVKDVLKTLQKLANYHRKQFNIPFIGITGSNGKTTTKELINIVLSKKYKTTCTQGNFNNHIGVPLTLLSIPKDCEMAIIEMGANHIGEINFLCQIAEPNFGIITNIGSAHIEGFGSKEGVKRGKNEMYQYIKSFNGKVFVNNEDETLIHLSKDIDRITFGRNKSDCQAELISSIPTIKLTWNNKTIISNLYGSYNFNNIMTAICIGSHFNVSDNNIKEAIEEYIPNNNRSQIIKTDNNTIFLDAYNANPDSMNAAIDTFVANNFENNLIILGDMLELGNISKEEHQKVIEKIHQLKLKAIFIGKEFCNVINRYQFEYLKDYEEAIDWIKRSKISNHNILIKGSRGIKLEKVVPSL